MASRTDILERVLDSARGGLSPDLARHVLSLDFPAPDHARYAELAAKVDEGGLSEEEKMELEDYLSVNDLLMILHAKAELHSVDFRRSLG